MAEERPPEVPVMLEKPPSGQPVGLLGMPPAAPPDEEGTAPVEGRETPGGPWGRTVSVRLSHLFVLSVVLAFVGGFALHAALFPGALPAGFISTSQVEQFAQLGDQIAAAAGQLSDSATPDLQKVQDLGRKLKDSGAQLKALAGGLKGGAATAGPSASAPPGRSRVPNGLDDDYTEGDKNAKVQFIEFSDLQCPFCRRFYTQSLSQLISDYVKTGKVLYAFRDFPLDQIHPAATPWAVAAECAREQGNWRQLHDKIFDEQNKQGLGTISYPDPAATVKQWAQEIGLDTGRFNGCLDSQKYLSEVQKDLQDGLAAGVTGTPTFYIGNSQRGYVQVVGAQPYASLKQTIDAELAAS